MHECRFCNGHCIKKGWQSGVQKLRCKICLKYQQLSYTRRRLNEKQKEVIEFLHSEGSSISTLARFLEFSKTTIGNWISILGDAYEHHVAEEPGQEYQADELRTFVGRKKNESWIMYAINKATKKIVSLCTGRRTKENLQKVTEKIMECDPKTICTDRLSIYRSLIPEGLHVVKEKKTNHIERMNLQFRNQLKRLCRRTICFSKSEKMLNASVRLCVKYIMNGCKNYEFVLWRIDLREII